MATTCRLLVERVLTMAWLYLAAIVILVGAKLIVSVVRDPDLRFWRENRKRKD